MESCLAHRYSKEMESIKQLIYTVRGAIEAEEKLLHELVLDGQDYIVDRSVYMYEPPAPDRNPGPPAEERSPDCFAIEQLEQLAEQFAVATPKQVLPIRHFVSVLHTTSAVAVGSAV